MAQLVVRDLEDDVKERLQRRAKKHGRSMEAEIRDAMICGIARARRAGIATRNVKHFEGSVLSIINPWDN